MNISTKLLKAAAGQAGGAGLDVDEVFSTYLYDGTGAAQTLTNGIDHTAANTLVWTKTRSSNQYGHRLIDEGNSLVLSSDVTNGALNGNLSVSQYYLAGQSNGFRLLSAEFNVSGEEYVSWTWRKAPKFFDVVTYTGNGVAGRQISHNLGSAPGMMFIKATNQAYPWRIYHRSQGATKVGRLDENSQFSTAQTFLNNTEPTSSVFTLGDSAYNNGSNVTYIAYLFAHNNSDGEFGPDGDQDIIKCGSAPASAATDIDLGFEPQWIMIKRTDSSGDWQIFDTIRGLFVDASDNQKLEANTSDAEAGSSSTYLYPKPNGFHINTNYFGGGPYIYMAIRRGPLAEPTSATDVFAMVASDGSSYDPTFVSGFPIDMGLYKRRTGTPSWRISSRLTQGEYMETNSTVAQQANQYHAYDFQNGYFSFPLNSDHQAWMWKRAPSYFDVVAYTGNGTAGTSINHNLGVVPEMIWLRGRNAVSNWFVYHKDLNGGTNPEDYHLRINTSGAENNATTSLNDTAPTASSFSTGTALSTSGNTYIAYLFATVAGVSKVGSYTGSSSGVVTVDCGFTSGARFVLIKRTDASGDWYVYDSVRGINSSADDPYLLLNTTDAESTNTNNIEPHSSGFQLTQQGANPISINGGSYIFYAIA